MKAWSVTGETLVRLWFPSGQDKVRGSVINSVSAGAGKMFHDMFHGQTGNVSERSLTAISPLFPKFQNGAMQRNVCEQD